MEQSLLTYNQANESTKNQQLKIRDIRKVTVIKLSNQGTKALNAASPLSISNIKDVTLIQMSSLARRVGLALLDKISFMLQTRNQQSQDRIKQQSTQQSQMIKKILIRKIKNQSTSPDSACSYTLSSSALNTQYDMQNLPHQIQNMEQILQPNKEQSIIQQKSKSTEVKPQKPYFPQSNYYIMNDTSRNNSVQYLQRQDAQSQQPGNKFYNFQKSIQQKIDNYRAQKLQQRDSTSQQIASQSHTPQHEDFYYQWSDYQANLSQESNQILERKPSIQRDTSLRLDGFEQEYYKLAKTPQNQNYHDSRSIDMTRDSQFSYSPANSKTNLSKKNKFSFDNSSDQDLQSEQFQDKSAQNINEQQKQWIKDKIRTMTEKVTIQKRFKNKFIVHNKIKHTLQKIISEKSQEKNISQPESQSNEIKKIIDISQFEVQQDASTNSEKEFLVIQNPRSKEKYTAKKSISKYQQYVAQQNITFTKRSSQILRVDNKTQQQQAQYQDNINDARASVKNPIQYLSTLRKC